VTFIRVTTYGHRATKIHRPTACESRSHRAFAVGAAAGLSRSDSRLRERVLALDLDQLVACGRARDDRDLRRCDIGLPRDSADHGCVCPAVCRRLADPQLERRVVPLWETRTRRLAYSTPTAWCAIRRAPPDHHAAHAAITAPVTLRRSVGSGIYREDAVQLAVTGWRCGRGRADRPCARSSRHRPSWLLSDRRKDHRRHRRHQETNPC
jgi:hypothetical protein